VRDYGLGLNTRTGVNTGEVVTGDNATGSTIAPETWSTSRRGSRRARSRARS
jgi:hypothetical protein